MLRECSALAVAENQVSLTCSLFLVTRDIDAGTANEMDHSGALRTEVSMGCFPDPDCRDPRQLKELLPGSEHISYTDVGKRGTFEKHGLEFRVTRHRQHLQAVFLGETTCGGASKAHEVSLCIVGPSESSDSHDR